VLLIIGFSDFTCAFTVESTPGPPIWVLCQTCIKYMTLDKLDIQIRWYQVKHKRAAILSVCMSNL